MWYIYVLHRWQIRTRFYKYNIGNVYSSSNDGYIGHDIGEYTFFDDWNIVIVIYRR